MSNGVQNTQAQIEDRALRNAYGKFATGVTVITTGSVETPVGITVNSFSSVSLRPALVSWAIENEGARTPHFLDAKYFAIHIMRPQQQDLALNIAKDMHGFAHTTLREGGHGLPIIDDCLAVFECRTTDIYPGGDHKILLAEVLAYRCEDGDALGFFAGQLNRISGRSE